MDETISPQTEQAPSTSQPALSLIDEARKEREETQKLLEELKKQKAELEHLHVRAIMGGTAQAGTKQEAPKTEEQKLEEEAEALALEAVRRMGKL